jgi:hypothetical protein
MLRVLKGIFLKWACALKGIEVAPATWGLQPLKLFIRGPTLTIKQIKIRLTGQILRADGITI